MTLWIVLGSVLAFFTLILTLPLRLRVTFDGALCVRAGYGPVMLTLYPRAEKTPAQKVRAAKKQAKKQARLKKKSEKSPPRGKEKSTLSAVEHLLREEGLEAVITYYAGLVKLAGTAARRIFRALHISRFRLSVVVSAQDAADTALAYGRACAGIYPASGLLEGLMRVRRRQVMVTPDFLKGQSEVRGELRLWVLPARLLGAALLLLGGYLVNTIREQRSEAKPPAVKSNG